MVNLGRPARPARLTLTTEAEAIKIRLENDTSSLPVPAAERIEVEPVELEGGSVVALVRAMGRGVTAAALLGRPPRSGPKVLWTGRLDPHGDPGERRADAVVLEDRTGDGSPDVVVATYDERWRICGQPRTLRNARALDPVSLKLAPVQLDPVGRSGSGSVVSLPATKDSPGLRSPPLLKALRFFSYSSRRQPSGTKETLQSAGDPLTDGNASTTWVEGGDRGGRGEFATATRAASSWPINAIALTLSPSERTAANKLRRPKSFWIVGDTGPLLKISVNKDPVSSPGERFWISPPRPLDWKCLSIVLDDSYPAAGSRRAGAAVAEVEVYTEIDTEDGAVVLVSELVRDGERAPEAARLLTEIGPGVVSPLAEAWPGMSATGRRRAVRVFSAWAGREASAREALVRAAVDNDEEVAHDAIKGLVGAGRTGFAQLAELAKEPTEIGDQAALAFSRASPADAVAALLEAIAAPGGDGRKKLREALGLAARKAAEPGKESITTWASRQKEPRSLAAAALALSATPETATTALALALEATDTAERFEDLWRLVLAARSLPVDPRLDGWLEQIVRNDERWMLRAAALEALQQRNAPGLGSTAEAAIRDEYPRVRSAAVGAIGLAAKNHALLATHARKDLWPMVRAAAVTALAEIDEPGTGDVLLDALGDPAKIVRAAAVRSLAGRKAKGTWKSVAERLQDEGEWPIVMAEAIGFARSLCLTDALPALRRVVNRGLEPDAWEKDVELAAQAIEAVAIIGGPEARTILKAAAAPTAPALLRVTAKRAARGKERCEPVP